MALNEKVCKVITDRVIALIEDQKTLPWNKCWDCNPMATPINFASGRPYRGINMFLANALFPESPYFLTPKKIKEMGGKIIKGSKALPIIFWSFIHLDENGKRLPRGRESEAVKKFPLLRYFNVFNATQIEGIEFPPIEKMELTEKERIDRCEKIVKLNVDLRGMNMKEVEQNEAFYSPNRDSITMPKMAQFHSSEQYYGVLFHEMVHWTGHKSRLDRFSHTGMAMDKKSYSFEELVAEIGSATIANYTQIQSPEMMNNSAAYLKGWLRPLKDDPTFLVDASFKSQKAVDLILDEGEE